MTVYGDKTRIQSDHYRASDLSIADSFAIDFPGPAWVSYVLLGVGFLVFVLGLLALYCYRKRQTQYPRIPSMHEHLVETT